MPIPTAQIIRDRIVTEFLGSSLIENNLRGYWCEAMVAEALGAECSISSGGWHPWDLQIGPSEAEFPERIRIQVKNSARVQTWNAGLGKLSDCIFNLKYSRRPFYFVRDNLGIPCEDYGFMCDVFVLCHHPVEDFDLADHTDPMQWRFFVVPVAGNTPGITASERMAAERTCRETGKPSYCQRRPQTLSQGIRGRPRIPALEIDELSVALLKNEVYG